jgi:hypothetical protein
VIISGWTVRQLGRVNGRTIRWGKLAGQFAGKGEKGEFDAVLRHFLKKQRAKGKQQLLFALCF